MSLIGTLIVGVGVSVNSPAIQNTQYNKLILKGQGTFDKTMVKSYAMTTDELDALDPVNHAWDVSTVLNAEFNNSLQGGALLTAGTITSWNLYRYISGETYPDLTVIGIDGSQTQFVDYTAVKNEQYYYAISPLMASAVVASLQSNVVSPCYESWILIDSVTGQSLILNLNLESGDIKQNHPTQLYEGFAEFPAVSESVLNYKSSQIIAFLGYVDQKTGQYVETINDYNLVCNFITNGHEKLIKDRKGNILRVRTYDLSAKTQDQIGEQPKIITFSYVQVGDV